MLADARGVGGGTGGNCGRGGGTPEQEATEERRGGQEATGTTSATGVPGVGLRQRLQSSRAVGRQHPTSSWEAVSVRRGGGAPPGGAAQLNMLDDARGVGGGTGGNCGRGGGTPEQEATEERRGGAGGDWRNKRDRSTRNSEVERGRREWGCCLTAPLPRPHQGQDRGAGTGKRAQQWKRPHHGAPDLQLQRAQWQPRAEPPPRWAIT